MSEDNIQYNNRPFSRFRWLKENRNLILIWVMFFVYISLVFYFYARYNATPPPQIVETRHPEPIVKTLPEDSLLGEFYNAWDEGDYQRAREIYQKLKDRFSTSPYTQRAADLILTLNNAEKEPEPPVVVEQTPKKSPKIKSTPPRKKTKSVSSPSKPTEPVLQFDKERVRRALSRLRSEEDLERGITWYYNKNVSHYVYKNSLEAYIGKNKEGDVWLRMRIYYTGEKLLEINRFEITTEGRTYSINIIYGKVVRGKGPGGAWEWFDAQVSSKDLQMLMEIIKPGPTSIKYIGKKGQFARIMTEPEKLRLKYVIEAYQALLLEQSYLTLQR
jgi:hypothetical protein